MLQRKHSGLLGQLESRFGIGLKITHVGVYSLMPLARAFNEVLQLFIDGLVGRKMPPAAAPVFQASTHNTAEAKSDSASRRGCRSMRTIAQIKALDAIPSGQIRSVHASISGRLKCGVAGCRRAT